MLNWLNLLGEAKLEESSADTLNAVEFAQVYFSYYPYWNANV